MKELFERLKNNNIDIEVVKDQLLLNIPEDIDATEIIQTIKSKKSELIDYINNLKCQNQTRIKPASKKLHYKLSSVQKRLFFVYEFDQESTAYNMPLIVKLEGDVKFEKIKHVLNGLVERHESLRTTFIEVNGEIHQKINTNINFETKYFEGENIDADEIIKRLIQPFDLRQGPLIRSALIKISCLEYILMVDLHHIISDGLSQNIFIKEFISYYNNEELPSLKLQYKDYAEWEQSSKQQQLILKQKEFWLNEFKFTSPKLYLPYDFARPNLPNYQGKKRAFDLSLLETEELQKLAKYEGTTLFMILLSIYNILLSKLSNLEDITVGTSLAGRLDSDLDKIMGMFVNVLPLRNYPRENISFKEFLIEVRTRTLSFFDNQSFQYDDLVEELNIERDPSRNPLFDVMFLLYNYDSPELEIPGLKLKPYERNHAESKFDLTLIATEEKGQLKFQIEYSTSLFNKETIDKFIIYFKQIVTNILQDVNKKISNIDIVSQDEKDRLIKSFNNTVKDYPKEKTISELFEQQAINSALKTAVTFKDNSISYKELSKQSDLLASILLENGVQSGDVVSILIQRSIDMIIALLATLKTGAAYLLIDPLYPAERIKYMLDDSEVKLVLTGSEGADLFEEIAYAGKVLNISAPLTVCQQPKVNTNLASSPESMAYVIYTSGSTSRLNGVMVSHRNVVNFAEGMSEPLELSPSESVLALTTVSYHIFVLETIVPLLKGMRVVMAGETEQLDIERLKSTIINHSVDILQVTPSRLRLLVEDDPKLQLLKSIKKLFVGGESFSDNLFKEVKSVYGQRIFNLYGLTETTVWSTVKELTGEDKVTIGKPIANTRIYILNKNDALQPIGMVGELYIAGDGVSQGYYKNIGLTEKKFVCSPFNEGEIIYRTGDIAKWLPNGELECFGRLDDQVKIRGYRIELGEIESVLTRYAPIKGVVVSTGEDEDLGGKYLCGYYMSEHELTYKELSGFLGKNGLPKYMVPSYFVRIPEIPLTLNGKVNKNALPEPEIAQKEDFIPPTTKIEKQLAAIWSEVLNIGEDRIGINSNFFEIGGSSFNAITLTSIICSRFNVTLLVKDIFNNTTIKSLTAFIKGASTLVPKNKLKRAEEKEYYPLSHSQKRMYLIHQIEPNGLANNVVSVIDLEKELTIDQLGKFILQIIKRYEIFRTSFKIINGDIVQFISKNVKFKIQNLNEEDNYFYSFVKPFDLETAPLFRVGVLTSGKFVTKCIFDFHHITIDKLSIEILNNEFIKFLCSEELPEPMFQYKDFTVWSNTDSVKQILNKKELFWKNEFKDQIPILNFPLDFVRPKIQNSNKGKYTQLCIGNGLAKPLKDYVIKNSITMNSLFLALYNIILFKYSGQEEFIVGTTLNGRNTRETLGIIGYFVNILPFKTNINENKYLTDYFQEVKEKLLIIYDYQEVPLDKVVKMLGFSGQINQNPLFNMNLEYNNITIENTHFSETQVEVSLEKTKVASKFDMLIGIQEWETDILLKLLYSTEVIKSSTAKKILRNFVEIIEQILTKEKITIKDIVITQDSDDENVSVNNIKDLNGSFNF